MKFGWPLTVKTISFFVATFVIAAVRVIDGFCVVKGFRVGDVIETVGFGESGLV